MALLIQARVVMPSPTPSKAPSRGSILLSTRLYNFIGTTKMDSGRALPTYDTPLQFIDNYSQGCIRLDLPNLHLCEPGWKRHVQSARGRVPRHLELRHGDVLPDNGERDVLCDLITSSGGAYTGLEVLGRGRDCDTTSAIMQIHKSEQGIRHAADMSH